ncbi:P-loop containing nucleoside triphosphate hydrolase [Sesbania bispinosa]|nr:P-loop containing nucleoside triphosphate hydrolase [Sesbania bispinosa]
MDSNLSRSISRSLSRSSWKMEEVFASGRYSRRTSHVDEDEEALKWAAIEKLPTYDRLRTSIIQNFAEGDQPHGNRMQHKEVDVRKLDMNERQQIIDKIFKVAEEDNEKFLKKVGIRLPTVEVRFKNLTVEADSYVGSRALPTLPNVALNIVESALGIFGISTAKRTKLPIMKDASGIIKPSRMALLLGPPSSGKTTLLLALAGKLDLTRLLEGKGSWPYFQRQNLDLFMKWKEQKAVSLLTILSSKILGLDICKDTIVGDEMHRGVSGGQKKRVTTGLDSSTTYQIVKCLQQIVHLTEGTILMSLLQPAPETFNLFDDIILISEGQMVYQGPREHIVEFFESCGFRCPERKGIADFLQESLQTSSSGFHVGMRLENELSVPFDKSSAHKAALVYSKNSVPTMDLFKACWDKEWLLIKRNSFVYIFKTVQICIIAIIAATVFLRTEMSRDNEDDGSLTLHRDHLFHPTWTYTLPNFLLRIPISVFESLVWVLVTYYTIGFAPEASRTMIIANTGGALMLLLVFLTWRMCSHIWLMVTGEIPDWWVWAYWVSPLSYAFNALSVNEMFAPRWMHPQTSSDKTTTLGLSILRNFDVYAKKKMVLDRFCSSSGFHNFVQTFSSPLHLSLGKKQAIISEEDASEMEAAGDPNEEPRLVRPPQSNNESILRSLSTADGNNTREVAMQRMSSQANPNGLRNADSAAGAAPRKGMEMKDQGVTEDRLQLLREERQVATLKEILEYLVSPRTKKPLQEFLVTVNKLIFIHPQVTIRESLLYSAFLRLPKEVSREEKIQFVDQVMDLVELENLKDAIVGLPGVTGLSTEQRKRLTIAVELVANPSIIFMDEPTSGLDARAAAIVMRTVRNTVDTGRTVVCTIHQPSIDIFEAFDELLLMKRGGQVIYSGPLGRNSHKIIEYFEAIPGVPKIKEMYNPATWMLEVSSIAAEVRLGMDFAEYYKSSALFQRNKALVTELSTPPPGATDLYFPTKYSQSTLGQFKSCLWKQWLTYWRSPDYNLVRYFFTLACALMIGTVFWRIGKNKESSTDLTMIIGAMYAAVIFVGINNCQTVQPIVAVERTVFYRERAAGMYSPLPYAIAQVVTEIPYVFFQTVYYSLLVYAMVSFEWKVEKFFWFFFVSFFSFLYFTYYGMMTVSITPNTKLHQSLQQHSMDYLISSLVSLFQDQDIEDPLIVPGSTQNFTVKGYIEDHYGFKPDFMGPVAGVLVAFTVFFAFVFSFCIRALNFQTR